MYSLSPAEVYPILTTIPLFKGVSAQDLAIVQERVRMRRVTIDPEEEIVRQGDPCRRIIVVMEGRIRVETTSSHRDYKLTEWSEDTQIIELEQLYGLDQQYARTYTAETEVKCIVIEKDDIRRVLMHLDIWRINLLNMLSMRQTRYATLVHDTPAASLEELILRFVRFRSLYAHGDKRLHIRQSDLGRYIGATRLVISGALHKLQRKGVLTMNRGIITFHRTDIPTR